MEQREVVARCFVKFAGGKTQLLPELLPRVPKKFGRYHEPFVGGGALFWALAARGLERATIADTNERLILTYLAIRDDVDSLIRRLKSMPVTEEHYYKVRARQLHASNPALDVASWVIYLNKTGFNGLFRVNKRGEFNVPWGKCEGRNIVDEANLRACSETMLAMGRRLKIHARDFSTVLRDAEKGDFVYADPPYYPKSETADFTAYGPDKFGHDDHVRLAEVARELKGRGVRVMLSNADVPAIRKIYAKGFDIERVRAKRAINSVGSKRGKVGELIIT